jgi:hypothetical protein
MNLYSTRRICPVFIWLNMIGASAFAVQAQIPNRQSGQTKTKPVPALSPIQKRGLETLDYLSQEARQINNPAIRADLQALIADAFWDFDKPTAKNIFIDAFKNARTLEDQNEARVVQTEILKYVWRRDRSLADELMKQLSATGKETDAPARDFGLSKQFGMQNSDPAVQQRLDLAKDLIENDSAAAAELIRYSLEREVSFAGISQLTQLKDRDQEAANRIFDRAVSRLQSMPSSSALTAAIAMADYVSSTCTLCAQKPLEPTTSGNYYPTALRILRRSLTDVPAPLPLGRELQERVLQYFHEMQALLALTLTRFAGPTELSELQTTYRERVQTLTPLKQRAMQAVEQQQRASDRFENLFHQAESIAEPGQRDIALSNLVQFVLRQDLDEELLRRLEEKIRLIDSKGLQDKAWSLLKIREIEKYIKGSDFEPAHIAALKLPDPLVRAKALRLLSSAVTKKGSDSLVSSDLLAEAFEALKKGDASIERSQMMFKIASDFINLKDYEHSFDVLEFSAGTLGQLQKSDFEQTNRNAIPNSLFEYSGTFGRLGKIDFDKTLFVAQSITWREFRLAAGIATCRSVLSRGK